jgi:hypothetical protein
MNWIWVPWVSLLLVVVADALGRRGARERPSASAAVTSSKALWTLAGVALGAAALRMPFAVRRTLYDRNVDEVQYAMTAAFARTTGESLFGSAWNLHGHQFLYFLGSLEAPFVVVDVLTSLVVGLTAFVLAWLVLRARGSLNAALLTIPFYVVGLVRFEGLGSNKELYVNLFLAAFLLVRLGGLGATRPTLRRLVAGACLGAAVVMKDQAAVFVLVEPLCELLDRARAAGDEARGWREHARLFVRHEVLAACGFFVPVGCLLIAFAAHGQLGAYLSWVTEWAGAVGRGGGAVALGSFDPLPAPLVPSFEEEPSLLLSLMEGLFPFWLSTVLLLGMVSAARLGIDGRAALRGGREFELGLAAMAACGTLAISIGMRWFSHYWMLLLPAMAPLAALRLLEIRGEVKAPKRRLVGIVLALLVLLTGAREAYFLRSKVGVSAATGTWISLEERADVERVGAWVQRNTPADQPILVWGWRPQLYVVSRRSPATRYVGGATSTTGQMLLDLKRLPPPSVVLTLPFVFDPQLGNQDVFAFSRHPELEAWLEAEGYRPVAGPRELFGHTAWARSR